MIAEWPAESTALLGIAFVVVAAVALGLPGSGAPMAHRLRALQQDQAPGPCARRLWAPRQRCPPPGSTAGPAWLSLDRRLASAGIDVDPAIAWRAWIRLAPLVVGAVLVLGGPLVAAVAAVAATAVPLGVVAAQAGRQTQRIERELPDALERIAGGLRSGLSLRDAVAGAGDGIPGPVGRDLAALGERAARSGLVSALDRWRTERPLGAVSLAGAALAIAAEVGGERARAIDAVATTLRQRSALAAEVRALSAQARASATVIALAPIAFAAVSATLDGRAVRFLFQTPLGVAVLSAGLFLDGVGAWWMARLCRSGEAEHGLA